MVMVQVNRSIVVLVIQFSLLKVQTSQCFIVTRRQTNEKWCLQQNVPEQSPETRYRFQQQQDIGSTFNRTKLNVTNRKQFISITIPTLASITAFTKYGPQSVANAHSNEVNPYVVDDDDKTNSPLNSLIRQNLQPATEDRPQIPFPSSSSKSQVSIVEGLLYLKDPKSSPARPSPNEQIVITIRTTNDPNIVVAAAKIDPASQVRFPFRFQMTEQNVVSIERSSTRVNDDKTSGRITTKESYYDEQKRKIWNNITSTYDLLVEAIICTTSSSLETSDDANSIPISKNTRYERFVCLDTEQQSLTMKATGISKLLILNNTRNSVDDTNPISNSLERRNNYKETLTSTTTTTIIRTPASLALSTIITGI